MGLLIRLVTIGALLLTVFSLGFFAGGEVASMGSFPEALKIPDIRLMPFVGAVLLSLGTGAWVSVVVGRQHCIDHQREQAVTVFRNATSGLLKMEKDGTTSFIFYHDFEQIESLLKVDLRGYGYVQKMKGFKRESEIINGIWMSYYRRQNWIRKSLSSTTKADVDAFSEWRNQQITSMEEIQLPYEAYIPLPYKLLRWLVPRT